VETSVPTAAFWGRKLRLECHATSTKCQMSADVLQLTASPWTTEASTRERWQFGALTDRKATSSNRAPSTSSLYAFTGHHIQLSIATSPCNLWAPSSGDHLFTCGAIYLPPQLLVIAIYWYPDAKSHQDQQGSQRKQLRSLLVF